MAPEVEVTKINEGLKFGHGPISREAIEAEAGSDVARLTDEAIEDPRLLVKVDEVEPGMPVEDDGCGDGRGVKRIFQKMAEKARSLNRSKVFGGGAAMSAASLIATGQATGKKMQEVFHASINLLKKRGVDYGAHTADHVQKETDCGCGAIDNAPAIVEAAVTYKGKIRKAIEDLGISTEGLDEVENNFALTAEANRGQEYSGKAVMNEIVDDGKVVKELTGQHIETRIILNLVEGYTVDQEFVRQRTGGKAEVFAVDVWRMDQLAEKLYKEDGDNQRGKSEEDEQRQALLHHQAFLGELVYTLATAAVLTKGDLPVYVVQRAKQYALAA